MPLSLGMQMENVCSEQQLHSSLSRMRVLHSTLLFFFALTGTVTCSTDTNSRSPLGEQGSFHWLHYVLRVGSGGGGRHTPGGSQGLPLSLCSWFAPSGAQDCTGGSAACKAKPLTPVLFLQPLILFHPETPPV